MPIEIRVGPPIITINQGTTFVVTDLDGSIRSESEMGAFAADTRFISSYRLQVNGHPWQLLSSAAVNHYAARWVFMNQALQTDEGDLPPQEIGLVLERAVSGGGLHDDLDITNYGRTHRHFFLDLDVKADFADLFDVRAHRLTERGLIVTEWHKLRQELVTSYRNHEFRRSLRIRIHRSAEARYANGQLRFLVDLPPGERWHSCHLFSFEGMADGHEPPEPCYSGQDAQATQHGQEHRAWHDVAARCRSSNTIVERAFLQAIEDMGALRMFDRDLPPRTWVPAAGIPWFVTLFGRDSLIVSLQNMLVHPLFARAALHRLAALQANAVDDYRDAQPGKIPHELRHGELATLKLIPHTPYYGTHDATPLYVIVLSEAYRWTGDIAMVRTYLPAAERCLDWVDRYGDLDGDGFQEYQTRSPHGYRNQGWKDGHDSVVYPDGTQVDPPVALCEFQGYVYDAKMRMAELMMVLGRQDRANALRQQAAALKRRFNEVFWMPDEEFFAFGLDGHKEPIRTITSNPGHCLWSGIVDEAKAAAVVRRLLEPDMWSGWGIRTLSARHPAFNPFSYQRGSVWPHDNAIIATGFRRYGFAPETATVAKGILDAAAYFASFQLPELFAGLQREADSFPVQYLGANTPQAWAAGSVFMLIRAMLGAQADAANRRLYLDAWLPDWLPDIDLINISLGESRLDLHARRDRGGAAAVTSVDGQAELVHEFRFLKYA